MLLNKRGITSSKTMKLKGPWPCVMICPEGLLYAHMFDCLNTVVHLCFGILKAYRC